MVALKTRYEALFKKLTKEEGPAATVEGEILRAVNTINHCWNHGRQHFSKSGDDDCAFIAEIKKTYPASAMCYLATSPSIPSELRYEFEQWAERNEDGYNYMKFSDELGFHDELEVLSHIAVTYIESQSEYHENEEDFLGYHRQAIRLGFFRDYEKRFDALIKKLSPEDDCPAETVEGEILNAVHQIIVTYNEDGCHHFAKDYGAEVAGCTMEYLTESESIPRKVRNRFAHWAEFYQDEDDYRGEPERAFNELRKIAVDYIEDRPKSSYVRNNEDCLEDYTTGKWTRSDESDDESEWMKNAWSYQPC